MGNYKEIPIKDVVIPEDNIRGDQEEVAWYMRSIKQHGLLQAIAVKPIEDNKYLLNFGMTRLEACDKLGWTKIDARIMDKDMSEIEFDTLNFIENEHRKDISALDRGRYFYKMMKKYNLTKSELAERLNVTRKRIEQGLYIYKYTPQKYRGKVSPFLSGKGRPPGKIAPSYVNTLNTIINRYKLTKKQAETLYETARQDGISNRSLDTIGYFLSTGLSLKDAIEEAKKYKMTVVTVPVKKKSLEKELRKYNMTRRQYFISVFRGEIEPKLSVPKMDTW